MQALKNNLPVILLIALEVLIGIFLLMNPEGFTRAVIIIFGVVMLLTGIAHLIRYFRGRKAGVSSGFTMGVAIVALVIGAVCVFASGAIIGLISIIAILYGIILIIAGCFKVQSFFDVRRVGLTNTGTILMLISGIIMIVFGVILIIHPFGTIEVLLQVAGVILIIEAVLDVVFLILSAKNAKVA